MKSLPAADICLYFVRQDTVYSYLRIYVRCRHIASSPPSPLRLSTVPLFSLFPTPPDALRSPCKCTYRAFIVAFCIHNIVLCDFFAFFRSPLRPQDHPLLQASPPLLQASPPRILRQIFCLSLPRLPFSRRHREGSLQPPFGRRSRRRVSALSPLIQNG